MHIENSNEHGRIDLGRLAELETKLGCTLPNDYRDFLIEHNGGVPENYLVCWPGSIEPSEVWNNTLGLYSGPSWSQLDLTFCSMYDLLPSGVIPFASDPGGNMFCIGYSGKYLGKVYFWNHEREENDLSIEFLSNSFTEFCQSLKREEDA